MCMCMCVYQGVPAEDLAQSAEPQVARGLAARLEPARGHAHHARAAGAVHPALGLLPLAQVLLLLPGLQQQQQVTHPSHF